MQNHFFFRHPAIFFHQTYKDTVQVFLTFFLLPYQHHQSRSYSCIAHQFYSSAVVTTLHISLKMLFMTSDEKCNLCTDLLVMKTGCMKIDPTLPDTCRFWGASEASLFSRMAVKFDRLFAKDYVSQLFHMQQICLVTVFYDNWKTSENNDSFKNV